jgi:hypothetical protein
MAKKKTIMSYASNLLLQINAKINKTLWAVPVRHTALQKKTVMMGAFSISKCEGNYALGFVGTINHKFTKIYNETCRKKKKI